MANDSPIVTRGNGDDLARSCNTASNRRGCGFSPTIRTTKREGEDVHVFLITTEESINDDIVRNTTRATEDTV